jgi:hypothetical protein
MKKSFRVATVFTGAAACAAAFTPVAAAATATPGATTATATPGHVTAPGAAADTLCVDLTFAQSSTYRPCVADLQVLLNDLYDDHVSGPDQRLSTDGYYGPHTANDVSAFNARWPGWGGSATWAGASGTWGWLCALDNSHGFHGAYWHDAGCSTVLQG